MKATRPSPGNGESEALAAVAQLSVKVCRILDAHDDEIRDLQTEIFRLRKIIERRPAA